MKMVKLLYFAKVEDPTEVLRVWEEDSGFLHIVKLPLDCENIFSSKEEIELAVGFKLTLVREAKMDVEL